MEQITWEEFQELFDYSHPLSVSIYMNTDEVGLQATKRKAQLQNCEREVMAQLQEYDVPKLLVSMIQSQFAELKDSESVWDVSQKALALFISSEFSKVFQLPIPVTDFTHVSNTFHLKPLIKLLTEPQDFYLLSLSQKTVALYKGDRCELKKVNLPNLPQTMEEVVGVESDGRHLQFHTSTATPSGGGRPAMYHGQSASWKDDKQRYLEKFLEAVDNVVTKHLNDKGIPLIISGTERMVMKYHQISNCRWLIRESALLGNDKITTQSELHTQAITALKPFFLQQKKSEIEEVLERGSDEQFSTQIDEILRQAHLGRVDTIVVAQGVRHWGLFDPKSLIVMYAEKPTATTHDLLDTACAITLMNGGRAYVLPPEHLPDGQNAVAVFRY